MVFPVSLYSIPKMFARCVAIGVICQLSGFGHLFPTATSADLIDGASPSFKAILNIVDFKDNHETSDSVVVHDLYPIQLMYGYNSGWDLVSQVFCKA